MAQAAAAVNVSARDGATLLPTRRCALSYALAPIQVFQAALLVVMLVEVGAFSLMVHTITAGINITSPLPPPPPLPPLPPPLAAGAPPLPPLQVDSASVMTASYVVSIHLHFLNSKFVMLAYITALMVGGIHAATDLQKYRRGTAVEWLFWGFQAVVQLIPQYQETTVGTKFAVQSATRAWVFLLWETLLILIFQVVILYLRNSILLEQLLRGFTYTSYLHGRLRVTFVQVLVFSIMCFQRVFEIVIMYPPQPADHQLSRWLVNSAATNNSMLIAFAAHLSFDFVIYSRYRLDKVAPDALQHRHAKGTQPCWLWLRSLTVGVLAVVMTFAYIINIAVTLLPGTLNSAPAHIKNTTATIATIAQSVTSVLLFGPSIYGLVYVTLANRSTSSNRSSSVGSSKYQVFLSHDWGVDAQGRNTHDRVAVLNAALKERGVSTWFDSDQMQGNIVERMAEGIDNSECVLVCVTDNYVTKAAGHGVRGSDDNVKREFDYACLRLGVAKMVPVVLEESMRSTTTWGGAVGFNLGSQLYIDAAADGATEATETVNEIAVKVASMCQNA